MAVLVSLKGGVGTAATVVRRVWMLHAFDVGNGSARQFEWNLVNSRPMSSRDM